MYYQHQMAKKKLVAGDQYVTILLLLFWYAFLKKFHYVIIYFHIKLVNWEVYYILSYLGTCATFPSRDFLSWQQSLIELYLS